MDAVGDNLLCEFPSVVDAVAGAVAAQDDLAKRNEGVPDEVVRSLGLDPADNRLGLALRARLPAGNYGQTRGGVDSDETRSLPQVGLSRSDVGQAGAVSRAEELGRSGTAGIGTDADGGPFPRFTGVANSTATSCFPWPSTTV